MLTDTTRRHATLLTATGALLLGLATLLVTDGHTLLAATALAIAYTAAALGVGLGAALLLDTALALTSNWGDKRTRAQRREDDTFLALADSIHPGWRN
jgi:hypothetical protein